MSQNKISLDSQECHDVLARYPKAVVHIRQQFERARFGLVFGAGIGVDLQFPSWETLLSRIAAHTRLDVPKLAERTSADSTILAQQLFQHYKNKLDTSAEMGEATVRMREMQLRADWRDIVRDCLYKDLPEDIDELTKNDRYLKYLIPIIAQNPLTVTYNFDDTIERLLLQESKRTGSKNKNYRTLWSGNVQLNAKQQGGIIYHPNGFLPREKRERPSDTLVFAEDSFADQLIDSMAGRYAPLSTHFAQTTCLLVGLSLQDPTLKHLLRQSATHFPGHFHYLVNYVHDATKRDETCENAASAANFNVFNLNTLFLTGEEIAALAVLITAKENDFQRFARRVGVASAYRFFIVGSVAAGKSTTVNSFRSMWTQDEWTEERAPNMEKAPDLLTEQEKEDIDKWVAVQVAKKNDNLQDSTQGGIHVIDRAPLDAFAFTLDPDAWSAKAKLLLSEIAPGMDTAQRLVPGHVVFLENDPEVMAERAISLHKKTNADKLAKQQEDLLYVYKKLTPSDGVTIIDAAQKTPSEVVREVARVIFSKSYREADMHQLLLDIEKRGYDA